MKGQKKSLLRDQKPYTRLADHIGNFPIVLMDPHDTDLVRDSSDTRRRFFDGVMAQLDRTFLENLIRYNRIVQQRNSLLKMFAESGTHDALMLASYHGRAEVVKLLLKSGATVDLRNDKGQTPLGGVAFKGYVEIATLLLDAGADPVADQGGSTPADFATLAGKTEILALLQARRDNAAKPTRWFSKLIGWFRR